MSFDALVAFKTQALLPEANAHRASIDTIWNMGGHTLQCCINIPCGSGRGQCWDYLSRFEGEGNSVA